jgi:hypothetical protein
VIIGQRGFPRVFYSIFSFTLTLWAGVLWIAQCVVMGINNIIGTTLLMNTVPADFGGRTFSVKETVVIFTMVVSAAGGHRPAYVSPQHRAGAGMPFDRGPLAGG